METKKINLWVVRRPEGLWRDTTNGGTTNVAHKEEMQQRRCINNRCAIMDMQQRRCNYG